MRAFEPTTDKRILAVVEQLKDRTKDIDRRTRHVSAILQGPVILAIGTNEHKTHPIVKDLGYRADLQHSEINALLRCRARNDLTLVNVRYSAAGDMRLSCPCTVCLPWCIALFDDIYYTTETDGVVKLLYDRQKMRPEHELVFQGL